MLKVTDNFINVNQIEHYRDFHMYSGGLQS